MNLIWIGECDMGIARKTSENILAFQIIISRKALFYRKKCFEKYFTEILKNNSCVQQMNNYF